MVGINLWKWFFKVRYIQLIKEETKFSGPSIKSEALFPQL